MWGGHFCPGHRGLERARPVASSARVEAGALPSAGSIPSGDSRKFYSSGTPPQGPCRNGDLQFTGDTGVLPLHRVDSLALLGSGIRAVISEPAGSNNQNQPLQPNDALFHPPLHGLEILTMP